MPEEKQPQTKQRELQYSTPPDGIVRTYSNNVSMASTRFDVRIIFGEVIEIAEDKAVIENRVQVTLGWHEAKLLGEFIQANVKAFEELNGPLKLPSIPNQMIVPETYKID